ncbi:hypothetical protein [Marinitoga sp. 1155]|uniref:hypothetical protein n=1 Tax=Marinitoga sp. 1155 TaxID=1428448 RepID=UPI000640FE58|nr:hypothetical protein [Marinitoga sp. 1155]AMS33993.1 hypothetical protein UF09_51 [Marinitoga camini virus 2]KLO24780.1 hypothetical protein X274_02150 [Marinitoga sp. 1155]
MNKKSEYNHKEKYFFMWIVIWFTIGMIISFIFKKPIKNLNNTLITFSITMIGFVLTAKTIFASLINTSAFEKVKKFKKGKRTLNILKLYFSTGIYLSLLSFIFSSIDSAFYSIEYINSIYYKVSFGFSVNVVYLIILITKALGTMIEIIIEYKEDKNEDLD